MTDKSSNYMENMGYSEKAGYIFVVIFSFLSILMNMIFIINYLLKSSVNKEKRKISSFEQILFILSISESFISLLWFLSATRFSQKKKLLKEGSEEEICLGCKILGLVKLFAYVFDWVLSGFTMFHLKNSQKLLNCLQEFIFHEINCLSMQRKIMKNSLQKRMKLLKMTLKNKKLNLAKYQTMMSNMSSLMMVGCTN